MVPEGNSKFRRTELKTFWNRSRQDQAAFKIASVSTLNIFHCDGQSSLYADGLVRVAYSCCTHEEEEL
jgi:hypothetical protein